MKTFFQLLLLVALLTGAYLYFIPGASVSDFTSWIPRPPRIDPATGKPLVECTKCDGTGQMKCPARKCSGGQTECDGPCIRLTKGRWIKNEKWGKGPDELWIVFDESRNKAYTKAHIGEVAEMRNGELVNLGPCKICNRTSLMPCKVCLGTALVMCVVCEGRKEVPDMRAGGTPAPKGAFVAAAPSPSAAPLPMEEIKLKNGKSITGRIVIKDETTVVIRLPDGKSRQLPRRELAE